MMFVLAADVFSHRLDMRVAHAEWRLPGATHGFAPSALCPSESRVEPGQWTLILEAAFPGQRCDAEVATFITRDAQKMAGYSIGGTPTLYPACPFIRAFQHGREELKLHESAPATLPPGQDAALEWWSRKAMRKWA